MALNRQDNIHSKRETATAAAEHRERNMSFGLRRLFRFRLRTLLLAVLVFSGLLGWLTDAHRQRQAEIASIDRLIEDSAEHGKYHLVRAADSRISSLAMNLM